MKQNITKKSRRNKTRRNKSRRNKSRHNKTRRNKSRHNKTRHNKTRHNKTRHNKTRRKRYNLGRGRLEKLNRIRWLEQLNMIRSQNELSELNNFDKEYMNIPDTDIRNILCIPGNSYSENIKAKQYIRLLTHPDKGGDSNLFIKYNKALAVFNNMVKLEESTIRPSYQAQQSYQAQPSYRTHKSNTRHYRTPAQIIDQQNEQGIRFADRYMRELEK